MMRGMGVAAVTTVIMAVMTVMKIGMQDMKEMALTVNSALW